MTAIIQFFTSHFFGNMVYGIINNLITFIFVWFIHAFIPYKPKYQNRKNLNGKIQSWIILNRLPLSWENLNRKTPHN